MIKKVMDKKSFFLCFLILFALCWLFPYTGDDWAWGSEIGINRLRTHFVEYNGRYFSNLIVLAMTRSNFLKTVIMSGCFTGIIYCIKHILNRKYTLRVMALFLLCVPSEMFRQSISWTSGFANYTTSILLTLVYICNIYWIFEDNEMSPEKIKQSPFISIAMLVLGVANTLIVEHLTIYNLLLSLFVILLTIYKYKKVLMQHISYALGCLVGTFLMFSNSGYSNVSSGTDGYRTVGQNIKEVIRLAFNNYFSTIHVEFYMKNIVLNVAILFVCILLLVSLMRKIPKKVFLLSTGLLALNTAYVVWSIFATHFYLKNVLFGYILSGVFSAVGVLSILCFVLIASYYCKRLSVILFWVVSIIITVAPLLVVNPIGSRCFFFGYVLLAIISLNLIDMLLLEFPSFVYRKKIKVIIDVGIIGLLSMYFFIFSSISSADTERLKYVKEQIAEGKKVIEVEQYPHLSYVWCSEPVGEVWGKRYKLFYGLPEDIDIVMAK